MDKKIVIVVQTSIEETDVSDFGASFGTPFSGVRAMDTRQLKTSLTLNQLTDLLVEFLDEVEEKYGV